MLSASNESEAQGLQAWAALGPEHEAHKKLDKGRSVDSLEPLEPQRNSYRITLFKKAAEINAQEMSVFRNIISVSKATHNLVTCHPIPLGQLLACR
jgi:hypothetical protein